MHRLGDQLGRIHQPEALFFAPDRGVARDFGYRSFVWFLVLPCLAPGDGRNDADFVAVFERRFLVLEEADVLFVDVNVDEAADVAGFIDQTFLDARDSGICNSVMAAPTVLAFTSTSSSLFVSLRRGVGIRNFSA